MEAVFIKTDAWDFVNGKKVKSTLITGDVNSQTAPDARILGDSKAKSDIILSFSASTLKQMKRHETS